MKAPFMPLLLVALALPLPACGPSEAEQDDRLHLTCGTAAETQPGSARYVLEVTLGGDPNNPCPYPCINATRPLRIAWGDVQDIDETNFIRRGSTKRIVHNFRATGAYVVRLAAVNDFNVQFFCSTPHEVRELTPPPTSGCSTVEDGFEGDVAWTLSQDATDGGFRTTAERSASGGNPGGFRTMSHVLPHAGQITVMHEHPERYDPAFSGAVARIRYSEDRIQIDPPAPNAAIAGGLWLAQGSRDWRVPIGSGEFRSTRWERASVEVTQADLPGSDFSTRGAPLRLGFYRANSTGGAPFTLKHGIDNWKVELCR